MKKWVLKAVIQKAISFMPRSHKINFWFQKYVTKGVHLSDAYFEDRLIHAKKHMEYFERNAFSAPKEMLELGTGWYPIVPIYFYLHGFTEMHSIDLNPLINKKRTIDAINKFLEWNSNSKLSAFLFRNFDENRMNHLERVVLAEDPLKEMNIFIQTGDARNTNFKDEKFGLITSNNTFEHIYGKVLKDIVSEFKRTMHSKGIQSHFIDMSDHFAHLDQSINIYNFLRFSKKQWKVIDNSVQPQNRWRKKQFQQMARELKLTEIETEDRPGNLKSLESIKVHEEWNQLSKEDLAISHTYIVWK